MKIYESCYGHVHNDPVYQNTPNAECYCVERNEVKIDDLYIRGEYRGQMYFTDLEEAQKRLKELQ